MNGWIACPGCGLKHSARPDGVCPRCRAPTGEAAGGANAAAWAEAAPGSLAQPASAGSQAPIPLPATPAEEPFPLGARVAGWVLYLNVLVGVVLLVRAGSGLQSKEGPATVGMLVVDLVVATGLVGGRRGAKTWALVRAALGGLLLTPILWSNSGALLGVMQLLFSVGLVLLLAGAPAWPRLAGALTTAATPLLLLLAIGTSAPAARSIRSAMADVVDRGGHLEVAEGGEVGWRLELPAGRWHPLPTTPTGVDGGANWPEEDVSIVVASKAAPSGQEFDLLKLTDLVIQGAAKTSPTFSEKERRPLRRSRGAAQAVRATLTENGQVAEGWFVVVVEGGHFAFVVAAAPAERFEALGDELLELVATIEL